MPVSERAVEQKILIAVDFGTTFSSVLWEQTSEVRGQHVIQDWPNEDSTSQFTTDTVPTILRYDEDGYRWGYQIQTHEKRYEWFKLGLDPSMQRDKSSLARKYPSTMRLPIQLSSNRDKNPRKITTDYLKALREHAEHMLLRNVYEAVLRRTQREYVITVPAVWTEKARDLTVQCAIDAGMGSEEKLHIVSEPEAAAMYAISKFREINAGGLEVGDTFVLCDAGGGTVDLISYTILSLDPILELEEAAPGSGNACGSIFLNRIFADSLNTRFGDDDAWKEDPDILDTAMEHFERVTKIEFNGKKGDNIPMAGLGPRPEIKKRRLELSSSEIKAIFDPVIGEVLNLILNQIQQTAKRVKLILLVGGFGNSAYLRSRIQDMFGPEIEVKVSPDSQTAVVRGALMKGLAEVKGLTAKLPRIRARKARNNYGTECVTPYKRRQRPGDDGHSPDRKMPNPYAGEDHVEIMKWFLNKGAEIIENEPKVFRFSTDQIASGGRPTTITIPIYCCRDLKNEGAPRYRTKDVEKLGTVTADIQGIGREMLKKEKGGNEKYYYVMDFDIEMRCLATKLEFTPIYLYGSDQQMRFDPATFTLE